MAMFQPGSCPLRSAIPVSRIQRGSRFQQQRRVTMMGGMWAMDFMGLIWIAILVLVVLGIVALIKYLTSGK
jgi:uncharacterized membrane protein